VIGKQKAKENKALTERVVLAMSGGVDSSVAASLLQEQQYDVVGVFMRHGEASAQSCQTTNGKDNPLLPILQGRLDHKQGCCSASDAIDARQVADRLGIPFYAIDMQEEFRRIVDYFVDEYQRGRTPNPCVQCNNWIKFGRLFDYADAVGAKYVATGHYARLLPTGHPDQPFGLYRGIDDTKDQSYALAGIDGKYLQRMLLPVGGFHKSEIRERAATIGLKVADKKDSQEICFVTSGKHAQFVRDRSDRKTAGQIVTIDGTVVGSHEGIEQFTVGQRKGLGVAMGEPYFVVEIDADNHRVVIGQHHQLARTQLTAEDCHWLIQPKDMPKDGLSVQIRYNSQPQAATVRFLSDDQIRVDFVQPAFGVAPGQLAVIYHGQRVLGGGWISATSRSGIDASKLDH
jgi:tRNA-specific 2-thiouridylase